MFQRQFLGLSLWPRVSSGYPRMLVELVLGFESHMSRNFEFICKNQKSKESTAESALRREQAQFDASRPGKMGLKYYRGKYEVTYPSGEGNTVGCGTGICYCTC